MSTDKKLVLIHKYKNGVIVHVSLYSDQTIRRLKMENFLELPWLVKEKEISNQERKWHK